MTKKIDLHIHSPYSDGELFPAEIMRVCCKQGLNCVALTDHDTVAGSEEAMIAAGEFGIQFFPGVELSCMYNRRGFHILGLGIDHRNKILLDELDYFKKLRVERAVEIVEKLEEHGWKVDRSILNKAIGVTTRIEIAKAVKDRTIPANEFFNEWLGKNCPCFVKIERMAVEKAIELIHEAGGKAIWAHPAKTLEKDLGLLPRIAIEFKALGLDGLEVFYSEYNEAQTKIVHEVALRYDYIMTAGSDFHWVKGLRKLGGYNLYGLKFDPEEIVNSLQDRG
ncbi:MAG: PHP domain-containing protein [Candidatus Andersenbacteria bacterium]|nr:PHP domain-containing protein [Candidatus Andersenbacteria bacterium]